MICRIERMQWNTAKDLDIEQIMADPKATSDELKSCVESLQAEIERLRKELLKQQSISSQLAAACQKVEPVCEVYRHGRDSHGREWHGIHWYDPNLDVPTGTKLFTHPAPAIPEGWKNMLQDALLALENPAHWREAHQAIVAIREILRTDKPTLGEGVEDKYVAYTYAAPEPKL